MSNFFQDYIDSFFIFDKTDFIMTIMISIFVGYNIYKINKEAKEKINFVQCDIVDNKAHWVYNNIIYYADIVDDSIDMSTRKKIKL